MQDFASHEQTNKQGNESFSIYITDNHSNYR